MDIKDLTNNEDKLKEIKRAYYKKYRDANKDKINKRQREWRRNNKDKVQEYNTQYWLRQLNKLLDSKNY